MRFQVPQFIETEVKLIGPFTLKQFLWLACGAVLVYIFYLTIHNFLFFILALPIGAFFVAFAFMTVNRAPLIDYVSYSINYVINPKKYVYKKYEAQDNNFTNSDVEIK